MRYIATIFFILVIITSAYSTTNAQINITKLNYDIYFDYVLETTDNSLTIPLTGAHTLIYLNASQDMNYTLSDTNINLVFDVNNSEKKFIVLKYRASPIIQGLYNAEKTITFQNQFEKLELRFINANDDNSFVRAIPDYNINGNKLVWEFTKDQTVLILLEFKTTQLDGKTIAAIIVGVLLIVIISVGMWRKKRTLKHLDQKLESKRIILTENEQSIFDLLKKQDGLMQQTLAEQLNLQKAHVSKLITKLERKELVERKQVGKVNKVFLKKM